MLVREGRELEVVVLSVRDVWGEDVEDVEWVVKEGVLAPLRELVGRVRWVLGEVVARDELTEKLKVFVGKLNGTTL
jgi:hypothetical protein